MEKLKLAQKSVYGLRLLDTPSTVINETDSSTFRVWWTEYMTRITQKPQRALTQEQADTVFSWVEEHGKDWLWWQVLYTCVVIVALDVYRGVDYGMSLEFYLNPAKAVTKVEDMWDFLEREHGCQKLSLEDCYQRLEDLASWCQSRAGRLAKGKVDAANWRRL